MNRNYKIILIATAIILDLLLIIDNIVRTQTFRLRLWEFAVFIEMWYFATIIFIWIIVLFIAKKFLSNRMPSQNTLLWKRGLLLLIFFVATGSAILTNFAMPSKFVFLLGLLGWIWFIIFLPLFFYLIFMRYSQQKFFNTYFISVFILIAFIFSSLLFLFLYMNGAFL